MPCVRSSCNLSVDYSAISGSRILPFEFTLDMDHSVLYPTAGENQRFCYTIVGNGEDTSAYADLSHFVLGVCDTITNDMLTNVSVVIDGVSRNVTVGSNVSIVSEAAPDPTTRCAGLKVDFSLDKVEGVMQFCFELARAYAVGPVSVCVKGGTQTASGLAICGPVCGQTGSCLTQSTQQATVCVPVTVTPYAVVGQTQTYCCGEPVVTAGDTVCEGTPSGSCTFTVRQDVRVSVPISFGADATTGAYSVLCGGAAAGEGCAE